MRKLKIVQKWWKGTIVGRTPGSGLWFVQCLELAWGLWTRRVTSFRPTHLGKSSPHGHTVQAGNRSGQFLMLLRWSLKWHGAFKRKQTSAFTINQCVNARTTWLYIVALLCKLGNGLNVVIERKSILWCLNALAYLDLTTLTNDNISLIYIFHWIWQWAVVDINGW